jgi:photosynthetic reaction center cytochrome c subunit
VPAQVWFKAPPQRNGPASSATMAGQNQAVPIVGLASLPYDPFTPYLLGKETIRVGGDDRAAHGHVASILQSTEQTYGLMMPHVRWPWA